MSWLGDEQRSQVSPCSGPVPREEKENNKEAEKRKNCGERERGREEEEEKKELTQKLARCG